MALHAPSLGSNVLVVRAPRDDDELVRQLTAEKLSIQRIPIMKIVPSEDKIPIQNLVLDFDRYDYAVFISANAARFGLSWLDEYWPMLPMQTKYFAIGEQTAQRLRDYGCDVIVPRVDATTEGLLELPLMRAVEGLNIAIFRGVGGRDVLADELKKRGAKVTYIELYKRDIIPTAVERARVAMASAACLIVHSSELLLALGVPPSAIASRLRLVLPSARIGAEAKRLGYQHVTVGSSATPRSLCEATLTALKDAGAY